MNILNRILTIALALFLISAGVAKFTTGHVFQYIEYKSGVDLFYPFINNLTGMAEILAGTAILYRPARLLGSAARRSVDGRCGRFPPVAVVGSLRSDRPRRRCDITMGQCGLHNDGDLDDVRSCGHLRSSGHRDRPIRAEGPSSYRRSA